MGVGVEEDEDVVSDVVAAEKIDFVMVAEGNSGDMAWFVAAEDVFDVSFLKISVDELFAEDTLARCEVVTEDTICEDDAAESDTEANTLKSNFSKLPGLGL